MVFSDIIFILIPFIIYDCKIYFTITFRNVTPTFRNYIMIKIFIVQDSKFLTTY